MDQSKKSLLLVLLAIALGGAAALLLLGRIKGGSQGVEDIDLSEKTWVICTNPKCQTQYEIGRREYFEYVENNRMGPVVPGMECQKCGDASIYRAVKCGKCGHVFLYGSKGLDFADRCPKCKYSKMEEDRKARGG